MTVISIDINKNPNQNLQFFLCIFILVKLQIFIDGLFLLFKTASVCNIATTEINDLSMMDLHLKLEV